MVQRIVIAPQRVEVDGYVGDRWDLPLVIPEAGDLTGKTIEVKFKSRLGVVSTIPHSITSAVGSAFTIGQNPCTISGRFDVNIDGITYIEGVLRLRRDVR